MVRVFALPLLAVGSEKRSTVQQDSTSAVDQHITQNPHPLYPQSPVLVISGPSPAFSSAPYRPPLLSLVPYSFHRAGSLCDSAG